MTEYIRMEFFTLISQVSVSTWILVVLGLLLTKWYLSTLPWKNLPPGPPSLPIVGSLPFLGSKNAYKAFAKLAEKYGEIYTFYLGPERAVFLNGYSIIKEALVKQGSAFAGRPNIFIFDKKQGIISSDGALWQEQRRYVLHVLRNMGLGKNIMEHLILDEANRLTEVLETYLNKPQNLDSVTHKAVSNVINLFAFGKRWDYSDPVYLKYLNAVGKVIELISHNNPIVIFPWLRFVPGDLFHYKEIKAYNSMFEKQFEEWIKDHKHKIENGEIPTDFIGEYLVEMERHKDEPDSTFTENQLVKIMNDMFSAGTDTTSHTLSCLFLHLIDRSDIQEKVYSEIADVIGSERLPTMHDRNNMPYTEAVLNEVQRIADLFPLAVPHATTEDVKLRGYDIPKGTMVMVNMSSVSNDPEIWPEPGKFKPERFLHEDGSSRKREENIPFLMGKRSCVGESMARMEIFLFSTCILQKFKMQSPENVTGVDTKGTCEFAHRPLPYEIVLTLR